MTQSEFTFSDSDDGPEHFARRADFFDNAKPPEPVPKNRGNKPDRDNSLPSAPAMYSVTQLTRMIKMALSERLPAKIVLAGEISNCRHHGSGHLYLTIKDENSQIAAVMWKRSAAKLKFRPSDGMSVIVHGRVDLYEPQGKYQFYIDKLEPSGTGALELAFRQLAQKLRGEGLFEAVHKKPLPKYPATIAIVTSPTGAAIEDIARTLNLRFPIVRKLLYPAAVQGDNAPPQIASAIGELNRWREQFGGIDLIIIGRGGGSIEDLWAFNEEIVARAVFASEIPIISAVGHEVDLTISDMVADKRAATPTAAAELAVPDTADIMQNILQQRQRLRYGIQHRLDSAGQVCRDISKRVFFTQPLDILRVPRQLLDEKTATLSHCLSERLRCAAGNLETYITILRGIEPHTALARADARLKELQHLLRSMMQAGLTLRGNQLEVAFSRLPATALRHRINECLSRLDYTTRQLDTAWRQITENRQRDLTAYTQRLRSLDPRAVLRRGYSITRLKESQHIVGDTTSIKAGDLLLTELAGRIVLESQVTKLDNTAKSPR